MNQATFERRAAKIGLKPHLWDFWLADGSRPYSALQFDYGARGKLNRRQSLWRAIRHGQYMRCRKRNWQIR